MKDENQIALELAAPFAESQLKRRQGPNGMVFTYVDSRAVAERLTSVLGIGSWSFKVKVADLSKSVVKGKITAKIGDKTVSHSDYGYPNSDRDPEALKSAASDALRRAAVQLGVARDLYSPERVAAPIVQSDGPAPLARRIDDVASDFANPEAVRAALGSLTGGPGGSCPVHGSAWQLRPGGISKTTQKPYSPFYTCGAKDAGGYCKQKPSPQWQKDNPISGAAQPKAPEPRFVPEDTLEDLPF
jgi:hypothetical protein